MFFLVATYPTYGENSTDFVAYCYAYLMKHTNDRSSCNYALICGMRNSIVRESRRMRFLVK
jgi:hypothetical protein